MGITISRVLSWVVIYLWVAIANYLLRSTLNARLLPGASCCGLGLPGCLCCHRHRWSLTPPFHPYQRKIFGGLLSVALALALLRPPVRRNPALLQPGLSSWLSQATTHYAHIRFLLYHILKI